MPNPSSTLPHQPKPRWLPTYKPYPSLIQALPKPYPSLTLDLSIFQSPTLAQLCPTLPHPSKPCSLPSYRQCATLAQPCPTLPLLMSPVCCQHTGLPNPYSRSSHLPALQVAQARLPTYTQCPTRAQPCPTILSSVGCQPTGSARLAQPCLSRVDCQQ